MPSYPLLSYSQVAGRVGPRRPSPSQPPVRLGAPQLVVPPPPLRRIGRQPPRVRPGPDGGRRDGAGRGEGAEGRPGAFGGGRWRRGGTGREGKGEGRDGQVLVAPEHKVCGGKKLRYQAPNSRSVHGLLLRPLLSWSLVQRAKIYFDPYTLPLPIQALHPIQDFPGHPLRNLEIVGIRED